MTLLYSTIGRTSVLYSHTLMSEFLTLVHPQINPYTLHTDVMTRKRDVNTNNGVVK